MPQDLANATPELAYVVLLFALFVVPRVLQRWRLPSAITSFVLGGVAGIGFGLFSHDPTIHLLSTFGIVSLFLFAGLEVDGFGSALRIRYLLLHLAIRVVTLAGATVVLARLFILDLRPASLLALALLTPSAGFILDAMNGFGLTPEETAWIRSKAIASELLALLGLFVVLQSTTAERFATSTLLLAGIVVVLPPVFRLFATRIAPYAPKSEFAFLLMMALVAAYATRRLGVYYLVGAFLVGVAARRFRQSLPAIASDRMLHAVEVFASFFAPFYFFRAGSELTREDLSWPAVWLGLAFVGVMVPLRIVALALLRRVTLGESIRVSLRIAVPMLPTLVFTLVLAGILRDRFGIGDPLFGALVVYALLTTLIPGFVFNAPTPEYSEPALPESAG
ncbi:MAG: cation:proton antiporter [Gemmatimonadota bacterium]